MKLTPDYYETKINNCITKAPFESGIEILVFNLLDEIVDGKTLSVVDISSPKNKDARFCTDGGIPDIAVVSNDFVFQDQKKGTVYGLIEVKAAGVSVRETGQIQGQRSKVSHHIATNGINWIYYHNGEQQWEINICTKPIPYSVALLQIEKKNFEELVQKLGGIKWTK